MTDRIVIAHAYLLGPLAFGTNRQTGEVIPYHAVEGRYDLTRIDVFSDGADRWRDVIAVGSYEACAAVLRLMGA